MNIEIKAILDSLRTAQVELSAEKGGKYSLVRAQLVGQIRAYKEVLRILRYDGPEVQ